MNGAAEPSPLRCPVCGARVRAVACGRCGADLADHLRVERAAWQLRRDGWRRLAAGDGRGAARLAAESLARKDSASARRLAWLAAIVGGTAP